jgi:hypothetical protein
MLVSLLRRFAEPPDRKIAGDGAQSGAYGAIVRQTVFRPQADIEPERHPL